MSKKRKNHRRTDASGRSMGEGPFVLLYKYILACPAYRSLSPKARALYVELKRFYYGTNNGDVFMPALIKPNLIEKEWPMNMKTITAALLALILSACAPLYQKAGASDEKIEHDALQCQYEADKSISGMSNIAIMQNANLKNECMALKGYCVGCRKFSPAAGMSFTGPLPPDPVSSPGNK